MSEAQIVINGVQLNSAQSMVVRVAVSSMLTELQDPDYRKSLGEIAAGYEARLTEVQTLIVPVANPILDMKVLDFFTWSRLNDVAWGSATATRVRGYFERCENVYKNMTLGQFVEEVTQRQLFSVPLLGRKCLNAIKEALSEVKLFLKP